VSFLGTWRGLSFPAVVDLDIVHDKCRSCGSLSQEVEMVIEFIRRLYTPSAKGTCRGGYVRHCAEGCDGGESGGESGSSGGRETTCDCTS